MGETIGFKFGFFVVWARNCATLYTIPAIMQLCTGVGIPLILLRTLRKLRLLFDLREFAGFCGSLRAFCGCFACFPVLPICCPKAIIPNSEQF